ncbi:MAG: hypothetical protein QOF03_1367 [Alphaproteobacteria bacterium]|jgi:hypothetical protein|nr:hypothetical protein [Alphaproteobacteria bacterium]
MSTPPIKNTDNTAKERQRLRLEQLLTVSRRLSAAIAADIEALERGAFGELKTTDPEIERLCAFYGREVKALKADGGIRQAPAQLVTALKESGAQLNGLLKIHERLVAAMRHAAEDLVQAVAEGVQKTRAGERPYTANPAPKRASAAGAIVYNKVI